MPDALGLSAIDLVSCAFIAVLLLNLSQETNGENQSDIEAGNLFLLQVEMLTTDRELRQLELGVVLDWKGQTYRSWEGSSSEVRWDFRGDGVVVALFSEELSSGDITVKPLLLEAPQSTVKKVELLISGTVSSEKETVLRSEDFFIMENTISL